MYVYVCFFFHVVHMLKKIKKKKKIKKLSLWWIQICIGSPMRGSSFLISRRPQSGWRDYKAPVPM